VLEVASEVAAEAWVQSRLEALLWPAPLVAAEVLGTGWP